MAKTVTKSKRYSTRKKARKTARKKPGRVVGFPTGGKKAPGKKKGRRYGARAIATKKYRGQRVRLMAQKRKSAKTGKELKPWFGIRRNPSDALKQAFVNAGMTFASMMGTRVLGNFLSKMIMIEDRKASAAGVTPVVIANPAAVRSMFVTEETVAGKKTKKLNVLGHLAPALPAALVLAGSILGQKALKTAAPMIQQGAAISFLDSLVSGLVVAFDTKRSVAPYVMPNATMGFATSTPALAEYVEWGGQGGYGEYLEEGKIHPDYDMGYGVDVEEALAEYVSDPNQELVTGNPGQGYGVDVEEALADDEVDSFQTGYASGTLARSVFSV